MGHAAARQLLASRPAADDGGVPVSAAVCLATKVAFLGTSSAYGSTDEPVACRETHMSWIFLSGEEVYRMPTFPPLTVRHHLFEAPAASSMISVVISSCRS